MTDNDALVKRLVAAANGLNLVPGTFGGPVQIANARLRDAINALREAAAVIKGAEGWVLVPKEATSEMVDARNNCYKDKFKIKPSWVKQDWAVMLSAAPKETE